MTTTIIAEASNVTASVAAQTGTAAFAPDLSGSTAVFEKVTWSRRLWRPVAGIAISAFLLAGLAARTDLTEVSRALLDAAPAGLALALVLVGVEVGVRALRWKVLLDAIRPVAYSRVAACLCIGYFANSVLPARLGDLARAQVAGTDLRISRLETLGTIFIERLADALTITAAVIGLGLLVPVAHDAMVFAVMLFCAASLAGAIVAAVAIGLRRRPTPGWLIRSATSVIARISAGGIALRSPRRAALVAALTVAGFGLAVVEYLLVAQAVGLQLTIVEAAVVMGALALSTSIPAAPGSLGTYEFVGVVVLLQLGAAAGPAAASVILIHVIVILPPAIAGLIAMLTMHVRLGSFRGQPVTLDPVRRG